MVRASTALDRRPAEASNTAEPREPRVLVVETDESARSVLEVQLRRDGFEVISARSGAEALRQLGVGRPLPDVVVLATVLDGEDGYSVCAELRGDRRTSAIPVLMLSRPGEENPQALADVVGVDECLARPLYVRDVAMHVRLAVAPRNEVGAVQLYAPDVSPAHLLRAVLSSSRSGQLSLLNGRGIISFVGGRVLDARVDGLSGVDALIRALVLTQGQYSLKFGEESGEPGFHFTLRELVGQVFPRIARWERLLMRSVPLDALLQVDFHKLGAALPDLPDAVNGVVRLFDARRDVRRVLLDSPLHETITLEVVTRLYLMGVVIPAARDITDGLEEPSPSPHLFEPRASEAEERMQSLFGGELPESQQPALATLSELEPDWVPSGPALQSAADWEGLPEDAVKSLRAFMTRPIVEPPEPEKAPSPELKQFADGVQSPLQPSLSEALAQIAPMPDVDPAPAPEPDLEATFFNEGVESTVGPSVSEAVLGIEPVTRSERHHTDARQSNALSWALAAALMLGGLAVVAWQIFSGGDEPVVAAQPAPVLQLPPLEPVVEIAPLAPELVSALAEATALYEAGEYAEAAAKFEAIVAQDPSSGQAWLMLGLARYDSGDTAGALEAGNTALAISPDTARAHLLLATVHLAAGHRDLGRAEVEKYLEQEPAGKFADEARALLKR